VDTKAVVPVPKPFMPHPNLSDEVNRNIVQSEIEGGVYLDDLSEGAVLEVETQNRWYTIIVGGRGEALISGHPQYCPDPVPVRIAGCTWGGPMLKLRFIGRGMRLEFRHPRYQTVTTSRIVDIRASDQLARAMAERAGTNRARLRDLIRRCVDSLGAGKAPSPRWG
jgi:hypothetical protein